MLRQMRLRGVRRSFTLVEAVLAIGTTSILLVGMGGALTMTMGAVDSGDDVNSREANASELLSRLNAELSTATSLTTFTPTDVAFTVPDRNGDGSPETVEYTWSGVAGGSVLRSYNSSTPCVVVKDVRSINLTTAIRPAAQPVESAEQALASCDNPPGSVVGVGNVVDATNSAAQYVRPVLPAGATSWKITKVTVRLKQNANDSKLVRLSVQSASTALKPSGTVLASTVFTSGSISGNSYVDFVIGPVAGLAPGQGVCIVLESSGGGSVQVGSVSNGPNQPFNTHWMTATSGTWSSPNDQIDMRFTLTGTVTTMVEP